MTERKKTYLIGAVSVEGVYGIGQKGEGKIAWTSRLDMNDFRTHTQGNDVAMTRGMWLSLPEQNRPLPDRGNIIVTSDRVFEISREHESLGVRVVGSVPEAIEVSTASELYFAGGRSIWESARAHVDELFINVIDIKLEEMVEPNKFAHVVYFRELLDPSTFWPEFALKDARTETETKADGDTFTVQFRRYVRVQRELF